MKRFYSMKIHSHNNKYKGSHHMNNNNNYTDDFMHNHSKNLMGSKEHNIIKARSTGSQWEIMGDSIDPALSLSNSSSNVAHKSSPRNNFSHLTLKKTSKFKPCQKLSEPSCIKKRAGGLHDKHSAVIIGSSDTLSNKRAACYNHSCSDMGEKLGAGSHEGLMAAVGEGGGGGVECSMCGDVGIAELLFLCSKCSLRPQHTYCGRSYPNVCGEASICNWCLHEQDSSTASAAKGSLLHHTTSACEANDMINARSAVINVPHPVEELQNDPAPACVNEGYPDEASVEMVGRHGKAFDYLLLVAAQSGLPQVISEASEIKQTNQINITGSKAITSSHKKANSDFDKKAKMGLTESNGLAANQARISKDRERSMPGLVEKLNMEIQSAVNMKVGSRTGDDGGVYAGENMAKRQRCSKGVDVPALKCRKRGLQLSPTRPNYRRYKLLADVVC